MKRTWVMVLLLTMGCATTPIPIRRSADLVRIVKTLSDPTQYELVGEVSCSFGYHFGTLPANIDNCRRDLRNRAAMMGAHIVVISKVRTGDTRCKSCVSMDGSAYRLKQEANRNGK